MWKKRSARTSEMAADEAVSAAGSAGEGERAGAAGQGDSLSPGVRALDHTADVGFEVRASSLPELFRRAALGMLALLYEEEEAYGSAPSAPLSGAAAGSEGVPGDRRLAGPDSSRLLELEALDRAGLLADWLRELLYLHEVHGLDYREADFLELEAGRLKATVRLASERRAPVRELKGVTYHGFELAAEPHGWRAVVIFDV